MVLLLLVLDLLSLLLLLLVVVVGGIGGLPAEPLLFILLGLYMLLVAVVFCLLSLTVVTYLVLSYPCTVFPLKDYFLFLSGLFYDDDDEVVVFSLSLLLVDCFLVIDLFCCYLDDKLDFLLFEVLVLAVPAVPDIIFDDILVVEVILLGLLVAAVVLCFRFKFGLYIVYFS